MIDRYLSATEGSQSRKPQNCILYDSAIDYPQTPKVVITMLQPGTQRRPTALMTNSPSRHGICERQEIANPRREIRHNPPDQINPQPSHNPRRIILFLLPLTLTLPDYPLILPNLIQRPHSAGPKSKMQQTIRESRRVKPSCRASVRRRVGGEAHPRTAYRSSHNIVDDGRR